MSKRLMEFSFSFLFAIYALLYGEIGSTRES